MLLYIWINKFRNITNQGFNLSSKYNFHFELLRQIEGKTVGNLSINEIKDRVEIFPTNILDFKVIVGENGAGKSSLIDTIIMNLMTENYRNFNGFLVTDKYIIIRDKSEINYIDNSILKLQTINNTDILNKNRPYYKNKIEEHIPSRIIENYLKDNVTINFSPLFNIDKVFDFQGPAADNDIYEYYENYINISLENQIIRDYRNNINQPNQYRLSGTSELLNFKIFETKRSIDFILNKEIKTDSFFKNKIDKVRFSINSFFDIYWESIDDYFKTNEQTLGTIKKVTTFIDEKSKNNKYGYSDLKSNLYRQFIYCVLKFEYDYRWSFSSKEGSNPLIDTLETFDSSTKNKRTPHTILQAFLENTTFNKNSKINLKLFTEIIDFIINNKKIIYLYEESFVINIEEIETINQLFKLFYDNYSFKANDTYYLCNFLLIDFIGLSNGEKIVLSLYSRLYDISKNRKLENKDIILLLDEPEVGLHPQWQTEFISKLLEFLNIIFPKNKIQIILTTHSPILLSDFPKNHILYLKKGEENGECIIDDEQNIIETFGANIHDLFAHSFFLKEGSVGKYALKIIDEIIINLKNISNKKSSNEERKKILKQINIIGEPFLRNKLLDMYYLKFDKQKRINELEAELLKLKSNG